MKTTKIKLMQSINAELHTVLLERYLRKQIAESVEGDISTAKMETLLDKVLEALENIDLSIDYLTSAITGHDPYAISIAQKVAGRGGVGSRPTPPPPPQSVQEGWSDLVGGDEPEAHEDAEDRESAELEWPEGSEEGDLRADARLGGDWEGSAIDDEPELRRPPKEHRREAIKILASFNIDVTPQMIDILAWELYNKAAEEPTKTMTQPGEKKPSFLKKILRKVVSEELKAYMIEKKKYEDSFYKAKEEKADELIASGTDEDDAYGIADTIVSKQGKKKKK